MHQKSIQIIHILQSDFLKNFNESSNKEIKKEENKIVFILRNGKIYNQEQILTIEKNNFINNENKPQNTNQNDNNKMKMTMQIIDSNNNTKIYIIYNKIEFNI